MKTKNMFKMIKNLSLLKKLLLVTGLLLIFVNGFISGVNASTYNIIAYNPEDVTHNTATLKGELYNPSNHLLNITLYYKEINQSEYNKLTFVENITASEYNINYYLNNLSESTTYEYYIQGQKQENKEETVKSNTIEFTTDIESGIFSIDSNNDLTVLLIISMLVAGLFLVVFTSIKFVGALILLVTGIVLLFSPVNTVLSLIVIAGGFTALFLS